MGTWDAHIHVIQQVSERSRGAKKRRERVAGSARLGPVPGHWVGRGVTDIGPATGDSMSVAEISALFGDRPYCPDPTQIARPVPSDILVAFGSSSACDRSLPDRQSIAEDYTAMPLITGSGKGLELTFTTSRSVSALWALGPRDVARHIEAAHRAAVMHTIAWLDCHATYACTGYKSVRQVDVRGLLAAAFTHHCDRYNAPHLHTHVAISGNVRALDGRWLTLDQTTLNRAALAASEHYDTRIAAELTDRLHLRFRHHGTRGESELMREVHGTDPTLAEVWLLRPHVAHPTTDPRPPELRPSELRRTWRRHAFGRLGHPDALHSAVTDAPGSATHEASRPLITEDWMADTTHRTLSALRSAHPTWQIWHLHAEAERQIREDAVPLDQLEDTVNRIIDRALTPAYSTRLGQEDPIAEPPQLRRRDGSSVYHHVGTTHYTSNRGEDRARGRSTDGDGHGSSRIESD